MSWRIVPEWLSEVGRFVTAVCHHWICVGGSAFIGFYQFAYPAISKKELPMTRWWTAALFWGLLGLAVFLAWRDEHRKIHYKRRREILTEIVDNGVKKRYEHGMLMEQTGVESIEALIKASDDFRSERDVEWVCGKLGRDPFALFEIKYGKGSFKGKRLDFLQDARVSAHATNDTEAMNYIDFVWAKENGVCVPDPTSEAAKLAAIEKVFSEGNC
jgi:hypothetical protein